MAIPANQIVNIEVVMNGIAANAGSTSVNIANVYHFARTTVINPFSKAHVEAAFQTAIGAKVIAALNVRYAQTNTTVRIQNDDLDQAVAFTESGPGAIAGDSMASEDMVYVKLQTGIKGKSFRGNKKYGPLSEADTTGTSDILNAAAQTRFAAIVSAIVAGFTDSDGNTWIAQVYSRTLDEFAVRPQVVAYPVIAAALNKRISSMNRRKVASVY